MKIEESSIYLLLLMLNIIDFEHKNEIDKKIDIQLNVMSIKN